MALFVVNRYDDTEQAESNEDHEQANLLKLKKLIEERKKAKSQKILTAETLIENDHHCTQTKSERVFQDAVEEQNIEIKSNIVEVSETIDEEESSPKKTTPQFKVLGTNEFEKKIKVKRVLPHWLSNPTPVSLNLRSADCGVQNLKFLDYSLKKKLMDEGIQYLFPVQAQVIPWLLNEHRKATVFWPRDICVSAPTGSGKTLAYVLPIIQVLTDRVERQIRALVILPVKELAVQVVKVFKQFCIGTNLKVALVTGSTTFSQEQIHLIRYTESGGWQSEVDIMVCTAGRLVEHLQSTKGFSLKHLRFLVMDEADRIMDHIQNDWLHHLNRHVELESSIMMGKDPPVNLASLLSLKRPPQKLFFSATLSQDPEKLKQWGLFQPKLFSAVMDDGNQDCDEGKYDILGKYTTPLELTEKYTVCSAESKPLVLYHLLTAERCSRVLCFTNSAQSAHRLTVLLSHLLKGEMNVAEISAALNRGARDVVLKRFQNSQINVLVSTDALARGIDIPNCDLVISYDPPKNVKTYIHRVGRTGRAGRLGTAVAVLIQSQLKVFQDILKVTGKSNILEIDAPQDILQGLSEKYESAVLASGLEIKDETHKHIDKIKSMKRGRSKNMLNKRVKLTQD